MLLSMREIKNYVLGAEDGEIGRCKDFLFDDAYWTVRYMVADTGKWLPGRKVLISPISLNKPDWASKRFAVRLTKKQIEDAPDLDLDAPVSRQYEIKWAKAYGYPIYWTGEDVWGPAETPEMLYDQRFPKGAENGLSANDEHLRSVEEVTGYHIQAIDGDIGHVEDFILDTATWTIRYMAADLLNWLPGRKVLVATEWLTAVGWEERKVAVDLTKAQIKDSPDYDPASPVNRDYEEKLYDFYGRPKYW